MSALHEQNCSEEVWLTVPILPSEVKKKDFTMKNRRLGGIFRFEHSFRNDWRRPGVPLALSLSIILIAAGVAHW